MNFGIMQIHANSYRYFMEMPKKEEICSSHTCASGMLIGWNDLFGEGFRRPADDGAAVCTAAGIRKPPRVETAGGVVKRRVRPYGDFGAGGVLPRYVERLVGKWSMGWRVRSTGRRRRAAEIDRRGGSPWRRDSEHGHCLSRAGDAEMQRGMWPRT